MQHEHETEPAKDLAGMPAVIHEEGAAAFFDSNGSKCPVCGGDQIEGDKTDFDGAHVFQRNYCLSCEKTWSTGYRLCNIYDPDHEETFEAPLPEAVAEVVKAAERMHRDSVLINDPEAKLVEAWNISRSQYDDFRAALAKLKGE